MPKAKKIDTKAKKGSVKEVEEKEIMLDDEEKVIDADSSISEDVFEDEEDDGLLDDEDLNPFKDKWEE